MRSIEVSWGELFAQVAPDLMNEPNEALSFLYLGSAIANLAKQRQVSDFKTGDDSLQTIKIQFVALGLITVERKATTTGALALFWAMSEKGQQYMFEARTQRKAPVSTVPV